MKDLSITCRRAGVLLHPTSLPSGKLDQDAWAFIDWMASAGLSVWQMLPLTQPTNGLSPYQSVSAFALNPALLPDDWETTLDEQAWQGFMAQPPAWLPDYALFMVLKQHCEGQSWHQWPMAWRLHDPQALEELRGSHADAIEQICKQQFALISRWQALRAYAHSKGILLFGDMPIFVGYDSVDVWMNPQEFRLDDDLNPTVVTGVPPDYFSATGQRWGNPHYDWESMQANGFQWWQHRIGWSLELFDLVRIDHFRGLEASWEIDAAEATAINGTWIKVPGAAMLQTLQQRYDPLPLIAEDLGIITPEVVALKQQFNLPGMSVLQFGFNGLPDNPHSLAEQVEDSVVYTGTHDNETSLGWWLALQDEGHKAWVLSQLDTSLGEMPWPLINAAFASPARMAIVPLQDFLGLDNSARMNTPGTVIDNWLWRYQASDLTNTLAQQIAALATQHQRV